MEPIETPEEEKPEAPTTPPEEPTPTETPEEEKPQNENLTTLITEIKTDYEKKISDLENKYQARLNEREEVIKQILRGEPNTPAPTTSTAFDKINEKRKFNIW